MIQLRTTLLVTAFAVGAGVGGCAQQRPEKDSALSGERAGRAAVVVDAIRQIFGTPEQRAAGWEREHWAVQGVLSECAERKNVDYTVSGWKAPEDIASISAADLPGLFEPARADFGIGRGFSMQASQRSDAASRPAKAERAQRSKFNECQMEAAPMDNLHLPAGQPALAQKFLAAQESIHHELEPRLIGWYSTCMTRAGSPAEDVSDAYRQAQLKFLPLVQRSPLAPSAAEGWAEAEAFETRIATADGKCRKANADALATASADTVATFLHQHRNEVQGVEAGWAAMPATRDAAREAVNK